MIRVTPSGGWLGSSYWDFDSVAPVLAHHMSAMVSHITSNLAACLKSLFRLTEINTSSTSLALCRGIHQWLADYLCIGPVMWKVFPRMTSWVRCGFMNFKQVPHHWPLQGNPPVICGFPSQRANNVESVSMPWHHMWEVDAYISSTLWWLISWAFPVKLNFRWMAQDLIQCMKWPVAHSPNSTWFWLELVGNCCERLKIMMKNTNIQFCERLGHGWQFHTLWHWWEVNIGLGNSLVPWGNKSLPERIEGLVQERCNSCVLAFTDTMLITLNLFV